MASVITTTRLHNTHIVISTSDDDDDDGRSSPNPRSMSSSLPAKYPHTNSYLSQLVSLYAPTTAASFSDDDLSPSKEPRLTARTAGLLLPKVISLLHEDNEEELKELFKDRLEIPDDLVGYLPDRHFSHANWPATCSLSLLFSRLCTGISTINTTFPLLQHLSRLPSDRRDLRVERRPTRSVSNRILQRALLEPSRSYTHPLLEDRIPQSLRHRSTSTQPQWATHQSRRPRPHRSSMPPLQAL